MFCYSCVGHTILCSMSFSIIRKRILGHGEDVESLEAVVAKKKQKRSGPAHGVHQPSQREQLSKLLNSKEDASKAQRPSNHPAAKNHTVSCNYAAM